MKKRGWLKSAVVIIRLLQESVCIAFSQLENEKFRSVLTLVGMSIGIFLIIMVFSAVGALKVSMHKGFEAFGSNVVSISQWPFSGEDEYGNADNLAEYRWWEYMRRPAPSVLDYKFVRSNSKTAAAVAMAMSFTKRLKYKRESIQNCTILSITYDWNKISGADLKLGRYFTEEEIEGGYPVGIIGYDIWQELFGDRNPIGCRIKIGNRDVAVIGVYEKQGESVVDIGGNTDLSVLIPLDMGRYMVNPLWADISIYAKPKASVKEEDFCDELMLLMRSHRKLSPEMKNDFSINRMTFLQEIAASLLSIVNNTGWVLACFSLLVGGFGIANIMFVSVKERTNIIGIQKALGAKRYVVLTQFLAEALFLSIAGGLMGVLFAALVIFVVPDGPVFEMHLTARNIFGGMTIASAIGIVSGILPALSAANLAPAVAINSFSK